MPQLQSLRFIECWNAGRHIVPHQLDPIIFRTAPKLPRRHARAFRTNLYETPWLYRCHVEILDYFSHWNCFFEGQTCFVQRKIAIVRSCCEFKQHLKTCKRLPFPGRVLDCLAPTSLSPLFAQIVLRDLPAYPSNLNRSNHVLDLAAHSIRRATGTRLSLRYNWKSACHFLHTRMFDTFSQFVATSSKRRKGKDNENKRDPAHWSSINPAVEDTCWPIYKSVDAFFQSEIFYAKPFVYDCRLNGRPNTVPILPCPTSKWFDS